MEKVVRLTREGIDGRQISRISPNPARSATQTRAAVFLPAVLQAW